MRVRTRVKICGITRAEDAQLAAQLGADALGFVFWEGSRRAVAPAAAAGIMAGLQAFVTRVGLFVDAEAAQVRQVCSALPLDMLQFHGDEAPEYCASFGRPYLKAIKGLSRESVEADAARYPDAAAIVVDSVDGARFGGTGKPFDWQIMPPLPQRLLLAGGLHPGNVAEAIRRVRPYGVDVSSGVEASDGGAGLKDRQRLLAFFGAVRDGDQSRHED